MAFNISESKHGTNFQKGDIINHSKVVHIYNIPTEIDKAFIGFLAVPFGFVDKIVFMKTSQALVQMKTTEDAIEMVNYYNEFVPRFYNKYLFIQFSSHQSLKVNIFDIDLLANINEMREYYLNNWYLTNMSTVVQFLIDKVPQFDIDHLVYYKIFSRFGQILRILSNEKNGTLHGSVEFLKPISAHVAQVQLNGACIFGLDETIEIRFSNKGGPLIVKDPNENNRDYEIHPLSSKELSEFSDPDFDFPLFSSSNNSVAIVTNETSEESAFLNLFKGTTKQLSSLGDKFAIDMSPSVAMAAASLLLACNESVHQNRIPINYISGNQSSSSTYNLSEDDNSDMTVIMVTNLNAEKTNPDALYKLFGVCGDVVKVKVMSSNRSAALVQYDNHNQALLSVKHMNGIPLWGTRVQVRISSTNVIKMTPGKSDLTKDYSRSTFNRFRGKCKKNESNIFPPNVCLHFVGIPDRVDKIQMSQLITDRGYRIKNMRLLPTEKKMIVIELESLEDAVHCLIDFHNYQWSPSYNLRVSFAKNNTMASTNNVNIGK